MNDSCRIVEIRTELGRCERPRKNRFPWDDVYDVVVRLPPVKLVAVCKPRGCFCSRRS
ncbi:uncharacterized protein LOC116424149 [Nomia melanderi]|uniref:uncharacterized protein LOC116424149 n=1 Tax=Nomia melanderi TaxID=2448451 RepID=UPI003FCC72F6